MTTSEFELKNNVCQTENISGCNSDHLEKEYFIEKETRHNQTQEEMVRVPQSEPLLTFPSVFSDQFKPSPHFPSQTITWLIIPSENKDYSFLIHSW